MFGFNFYKKNINLFLYNDLKYLYPVDTFVS